MNNLSDTPLLKEFLEEVIEKVYGNSRKLAIKEGQLARFEVRVPDQAESPLICPFYVEQILDEDFLGSEDFG